MQKMLMDHPEIKRVSRFNCVGLFLDFVSMSQDPFLPGHEPRSSKQKDEFEKALKHMHHVYLYSDVILHIDLLCSKSFDGGTVAVPKSDLGSVIMHQIGNSKQVHWLPEPVKYGLHPGDLAIGEDAHHITFQRRTFGATNLTPPNDRGWLFFERVITMVRVAMTGTEDGLLTTSDEVREQIAFGAHALVAARSNEQQLSQVLGSFQQELISKVFQASSTYKRQTSQGLNTLKDDASKVHAMLKELVEHLQTSWQETRAFLWNKAFLEIVDDLYNAIEADDMLNPFFRGTKSDTFRRNQATFLRDVWLGSKPSMDAEMHRPWNIDSSHFESFMRHLQNAAERHLDKPLSKRAQAVLDTLKSYKPLVVQPARFPDAPLSLEDGDAAVAWLQNACQIARLGRLPQHWAEVLVHRLIGAAQGETMEQFAPIDFGLSAHSVKQLCALLPSGLQVAGVLAFSRPGQDEVFDDDACPSQVVSFYEDFVRAFYDKLESDEMLAVFSIAAQTVLPQSNTNNLCSSARLQGATTLLSTRCDRCIRSLPFPIFILIVFAIWLSRLRARMIGHSQSAYVRGLSVLVLESLCQP
eukprot:TRINITY_DN9349_c0_g2_i1.p1 TRINITY_DN9349_c0_g2~~TRINITY_DN9349_c0_g2_i1.p1  ORF type:complete len:581 (-),score=91.40 TRINITY_DN9349_c0_g2_i1:243-1985(-)